MKKIILLAENISVFTKPWRNLRSSYTGNACAKITLKNLFVPVKIIVHVSNFICDRFCWFATRSACLYRLRKNKPQEVIQTTAHKKSVCCDKAKHCFETCIEREMFEIAKLLTFPKSL